METDSKAEIQWCGETGRYFRVLKPHHAIFVTWRAVPRSLSNPSKTQNPRRHPTPACGIWHGRSSNALQDTAG